MAQKKFQAMAETHNFWVLEPWLHIWHADFNLIFYLLSHIILILFKRENSCHYSLCHQIIQNLPQSHPSQKLHFLAKP